MQGYAGGKGRATGTRYAARTWETPRAVAPRPQREDGARPLARFSTGAAARTLFCAIRTERSRVKRRERVPVTWWA
jgi:hypothetical protein